MDTASFNFLLFGLVVAAISNLSRSRRWRSAVLLLSSLVFICLLAKNAVVLLPLAGFLMLGYVGVAVRGRSSSTTIGSIVSVIFAFVWLKKYTFLPGNILLPFPYVTVGMSYIFFRVLHLIIASGDHGEKRRVGLGRYLVYTLNFTTLISGPIQRYDEFARDQFTENPIALTPGVVGRQMERIILGFFKVNVLGLLLDTAWQDASVQLLSHVPPLPLKLFAAFRLAVIYPFFLYANFSGYIDIVIALARLMRVCLPENFNHPFAASSFLEFWTRWHITLSTWLKMYVYNPLLLVMMRRTSSRKIEPLLGVLSYFVTFFLVGIWHGRTSEFAFFGVLQACGVAANKMWQLCLTRGIGSKSYKALAASPVYIAFGRGLTFSWFAFTLVWFWASWQQIAAVLAVLGVINSLFVWMLIWFCATALLTAWEWLRTLLGSQGVAPGWLLTSRYVRVMYATVLALVIFVMTVLFGQAAPGIVYRTF